MKDSTSRIEASSKKLAVAATQVSAAAKELHQQNKTPKGGGSKVRGAGCMSDIYGRERHLHRTTTQGAFPPLSLRVVVCLHLRV